MDQMDCVDQRDGGWKMKLYLSGPMTGKPDFNRPEFGRWAQKLRAKGYQVENPGELPPGLEWEEYMKIAKEALAGCDAVALLPGYLDSKGAQQELRWAIDARMPFATVKHWYDGLGGARCS
jgi:hypothetical protein